MTIATVGTSAADIEYHYDVGNDFYQLWLDQDLTYTAALWDGIEGDESDPALLARAQHAKLAHHLDAVHALAPARPSEFRLLDVGCGWGSLAAYATRTGRVGEATGLTISRAQAEYVRSLGLPEVRARLESWDSYVPERPYDGVVTIGAFEHFAVAGMSPQERAATNAAFFAKAHGWLRPGGRLSLQTIAYDGAAGAEGPLGGFVVNDIFPGGTLPRLSEIATACDPYFSVEFVRSSPDDYARTLRSWSARLLRARAEAERVVGAETVHRYRLYLRACEVTFLRRAATLYRIGLLRRDEPLRLAA